MSKTRSWLVRLLVVLIAITAAFVVPQAANAGFIGCGNRGWWVTSANPGARFYVHLPCFGNVLMVPGDQVQYDTPPLYASMRIDPRTQCRVDEYGGVKSIWYNQSYTYSIDKTIPSSRLVVESCWNY